MNRDQTVADRDDRMNPPLPQTLESLERMVYLAAVVTSESQTMSTLESPAGWPSGKGWLEIGRWIAFPRQR